MKRKNGFTLIELLAVIVVLAIIALIATPIVMNTIKNLKKGAAERTADNYVEQVETSLMTYRLEHGENLPDGTYTIDENGNLTGNVLSNPLTIEMSGTKPSSGTIVIENGQVKKDGTTMTVGDYDVTYNSTNKTFVASESSGSNTEVLCKAKEEVTNGNKAEGNYNYGDEYICELGDNDPKTFYVLDVNGDNVSLIMNMNIDENGKGTTSGNTVAWCTYDDHIASGRTDEDWMNYDGTTVSPVTALKYLKSSTRSWTKLGESQIVLPSIYQLVDASDTTDGYAPSLDLVSSPYFSWANWIYENLNRNTAPYGYWVSNSLSNSAPMISCYNHNKSWYPYCEMTKTDEMGVRPVITISKTQLG